VTVGYCVHRVKLRGFINGSNFLGPLKEQQLSRFYVLTELLFQDSIFPKCNALPLGKELPTF